MGNHETFEEQDGMKESPKGNRRPVLLIFGGVLFVGMLVLAALAGGQMLSLNFAPFKPNKRELDEQNANRGCSLQP